MPTFDDESAISVLPKSALTTEAAKHMPKRSTSEQVPKEMQGRFDEITHLTNAYSAEHLNEEYASVCRQLTATLCRKRPSPLSQGKVNTWACAIIHALGTVNFLFDSSQKPHVQLKQVVLPMIGS